MAKKAKKVKTAKGAELRIVNPDAAGIDIADGIMQVCVPADRSKDNNRAFGAYTSDLHAISAWLRECGIKTVAIEKIQGTYFEICLRYFKICQTYFFAPENRG